MYTEKQLAAMGWRIGPDGRTMVRTDTVDSDTPKNGEGGKYHVSRKDERTADGIVFASKREMNRYNELVMAQKAGVVLFFLRQVPMHLEGNTKYVCDFLVFFADGHWEFQDVKGFRTQMYKLKKKQVEARYGIRIIEVR